MVRGTMTDAGKPPTEASAHPDPAVDAILAALARVAPGRSISPIDVAQALAAERAKEGAEPLPDAWRRYLTPVKQQALHLARQGRIVILRKGKPVDPHAPIKGVIRLAAAPPPD